MNRLIPELSQWNNGGGVDIDGWLAAMGTFELAIGYGELFWPEFVTHDGGVYFAQSFREENYRDWMRSTNDDRTAVQVVMNHVHILDLFSNVDVEPTIDQIVYIGRRLKEMWEAKLRRDFPDCDITVSFPEDNCADLLQYEVTLFIRDDAGLDLR